MRGAIRLALAMLAIASPAAAAEMSPASDEAIAWDPAIRHGVLPNGLRYAVMRNATPAGGVSLRLGVAVGSLDETDAERGAAHFVEHLAFGDGGPGTEPEASFAAAGAAFGRDRNAETGYYSTTYRIDLPRAGGKALPLAFAWLRAAADGGDFGEAAVSRERGVILAERESELTDETAAQEARLAFVLPGQRVNDRDPIGTLPSLAAMTPERLKAFRQRWYRPANAVVVVVGDAPPEALAAQVAAAFGDWSPGPIPERAASPPVDATPGLEAKAIVARSAITNLLACRAHPAPARGADDVARLRGETLTDLWRRVLDRRLAADRRDPAASMIGASVITAWEDRDAAGACVAATPSGDAFAPALARLRAETDRMAAAPPSEPELDAALKEARSYLRGPADQAATRPSPELATHAVELMLRGDVVPSPAEAFRAFDSAVADVTPEDLRAAFRRDWAGSGPRIVVVGATAATGPAILAAWNAPSAPPAVTEASRPAETWAYNDFGPAGKVVRREVFPGADYVRLTFANGVTLNFKHTSFEQNQVKVAMAFGAGRREIADADDVAAQIGAVLIKQGGLGRHDIAAIDALFADRGWGADLHIGPHAFVLEGGGGVSALEGQLQILAAFATDPGFRDIDPLISTVVAAVYSKTRADPRLALGQALTEGVAPGGPESLPPREVLARLRTADLRRIFRPPLTQAPLRLTIVGDVSEAQAVSFTAETLGALPARPPAAREKAGVSFLRFPTVMPGPIEATHDGPPERALTAAVWPLYVATPARRREEYALGLTAALLQERLVGRLRGDLGKTYSPAAATSMPDEADQGLLEALVETAPGDVDLARREIEASAARLAQGDVTSAQLEAVRAPLVARIAQAERTNGYWLDALANAAGDDDLAAVDAADWRSAEASITLEEVRKAAAVWLSRPPIIVVVRPKPSAGPGASP